MSTMTSPRADLAALDGLDGGFFCDEDSGGAGVAIDAVFANDGGVDGGALDDGTLGREIADGEANGRGESALAGTIGGHDHVVGIDAVSIW